MERLRTAFLVMGVTVCAFGLFFAAGCGKNDAINQAEN
jgi:hypothetical protein